jgi:hypothetical protein
MILRPQFWRGQQHSGRSAPPYARHMRALCDIVSSDTGVNSAWRTSLTNNF